MHRAHDVRIQPVDQLGDEVEDLGDAKQGLAQEPDHPIKEEEQEPWLAQRHGQGSVWNDVFGIVDLLTDSLNRHRGSL